MNTSSASLARALASMRTGAALVFLMALTLLQQPSAYAQPPVLQRGYDAGVTGATLNETTLTTSNVTAGSFGLVFKLPVDDVIFAQPLYVPNVLINGAAHNGLYVATMSDTLYAFDADVGGPPLWTRNLATFENAAPVPMANFAYSRNRNIVGNLGILSTPVIDLSSNTLYAVACALENNTMVYRLHAVDITTGVPRTGSGVVISGSYSTSTSSTVTFDARNQWQRVSLVLSNNNVVLAFGALELESTANLYGGWIMAYDKSSLAQTGIFATVTSGNGGGGVWQSGRPPVLDTSGNVYVISGNAYGGGYNGTNNFSESVLKLDPANGLRLLDSFTPSNWSTLDSKDLDLTSSGPMLVPGTARLVGGGKTGVLYVLNTTGLGGNTSNDSGAVQEIKASVSELRGGPVYWPRSAANGGPLLFDWGVNDAVKAFAFNTNTNTFAATPSAQGSVTDQIWPGGFLTLSANADTPGSGVLWATVAVSGDAENKPPVPGELYAFDAGNVARELWNSNLNAARDSLGNFAKFVPPLVANGRVYVATSSKQVAVYGLTGGALAPIVSAISPSSGLTAGGTPVTITGSNFVSGARVSFGGNAATSVVVVSASKITANTPPQKIGGVNVVVTNPDGQSGTLASGFTYHKH
jgi:IPT/TIG domain